MGKAKEKISVGKSPVAMTKSPQIKKKSAGTQRNKSADVKKNTDDNNNIKVGTKEREEHSSTPSSGTDKTVAATTQAELGNVKQDNYSLIFVLKQ